MRLGFLAALLCIGAPTDPATVTWLDDLEKGRATALQSGKPLLIVFR